MQGRNLRVRAKPSHTDVILAGVTRPSPQLRFLAPPRGVRIHASPCECLTRCASRLLHCERTALPCPVRFPTCTGSPARLTKAVHAQRTIQQSHRSCDLDAGSILFVTRWRLAPLHATGRQVASLGDP